MKGTSSISHGQINHFCSSEPFYGSPRPPPPEPHDLSFTQRVSKTVHSAVTVFSNPARDDALAALGELTGHVALVSIRDRMLQDPTGQRLLRERPTVDNTSLLRGTTSIRGSESGASKLTFGRAYASFMKKHGFEPEARSGVLYVSDPELAYVMLRYRQCHDFWHTLCDLPPTVLGELALKWVELLQTGLPIAALSATVGSLKLSPEQRDVLFEVYYPWAIEVGNQAHFLMNVYYEENFDVEMDTMRQQLGVIPAPKLG